MSEEVSVVSDDQGTLIFGNENSVQQFCERHGLTEWSHEIPRARLGRWLRLGAQTLSEVNQIAQQSGVYIKLTPDSAAALKAAGGLMPTATKGISHVMLGKTGTRSLKWLQADTRTSALAHNPAVLRGVSGLLTSLSQQLEAQELNEFVARIDAKLDEVLRNQRNETLAKIQTAADQIEDALTSLDSDGDPQTIWELVRSANERITTVQNEALNNLNSVVEIAKVADSNRQLKKLSYDLEGRVNLWLSVLARCFELKDQFNIIELDHVIMTAPDKYNGHCTALANNRQRRQRRILTVTSSLLSELDKAGALAIGRTIVHPQVAKQLVNAVNSAATEIDGFCRPLGITNAHPELVAIPWRHAWKDPEQVKEGAKATAKTAATAAGPVLSVALGVGITKNLRNAASIFKILR
ncbi:MAG: hypothetical protein Q4B12_01630 [Bowdeniella nasicola]|nr:hypothetical protein [Bowdeniella nasicola]